MKLSTYIVCFFIISSSNLFGQIVDSTFLFASDSLEISELSDIDSFKIESQAENSLKISDDALETNINWGAVDTMWFDKKNNKVHLYGSAYVKYETISLKSGYITFDFDKNEALALPIPDSLGKESEIPFFEDGEQSFKAKKLRYNFKSRKGMVYEAIKKEGDLFVHGAKTKYISKEADTINHVETIYAQNGIITSCDADHPHFGIRSQKIKIVPNKLAILGFSNLEIADIPTPLMLPFGFYPIFKDQRSGIILPKNYTFDDNLGYGFTGVGVYFPVNDFYDLKLTGDIYTRGSWGLHVTSKYKKRYKYTGSINLSYFNTRKEVVGNLDKNSSHAFSFSLSHSQDIKAHPFQKFGGSIALTLNGYDQTFYTDAGNRLKNTTRSNFTYYNSLPNSLFSFDVGLEHSQNTQSRDINISFPVSNLKMKTYYPFKSMKSSGKEKWYEKINIIYNAKAKNMISAKDTTLFDAETLSNAKFGIRHDASSSASFDVLKYFKLTPSVNYSEIYFFKKRDISFDPTITIDSVGIDEDGVTQYDTSYGHVVFDTIKTIKPYRDFSARVNLVTKRYGKILFNKGWLRGVRHVMGYNVGFNYSPNTKDIYEVEIDKDGRDSVEMLNRYNIFINGPYGRGNPSIKQMAVNYSISNTIEGKYYSRADSTAKKFDLLKSFNISGNYNFAADSLRFSLIKLSASTTLFNNLVYLRYTGLLDPYMEKDGNRVNTLVWDEKRRPVRHVSSTLYINSGFTIKQLVNLFKSDQKAKKNRSNKTLKQESSLMEMFENFRIKYDLGLTWNQKEGRDTFLISRNVISTQGSIKLTNKWNVRIGHIGYDFKGQSITYPDLGFERNLHCWTMNFSWRPQAGQYSFFIGVRSTTLDFLKYRHGQSPIESAVRGRF